MFLSLGSDINITKEDQTTPLFMACFKGHLDIVQLLLAEGAARANLVVVVLRWVDVSNIPRLHPPWPVIDDIISTWLLEKKRFAHFNARV